MSAGNRGKKMGEMAIQTAAANATVRQRLLLEAAELFTQKGYAATTVREIVAAAGVSKPALYYYFRNKEGIYLELMRETFAKADRLMGTPFEEQGSATKRLLRFCDRAFALFLEELKVVRVMYAIYYGPHQGAPFFDFDAYHLKFHDTVRRLVEEGIRKREFRKGNAEEMTWAVIGAINVAMEVHLSHPEVSIGREGIARVLKLILTGIAAKKRRRK